MQAHDLPLIIWTIFVIRQLLVKGWMRFKVQLVSDIPGHDMKKIIKRSKAVENLEVTKIAGQNQIPEFRLLISQF